jgi:putative ABC transport system ATP-binding protein
MLMLTLEKVTKVYQHQRGVITVLKDLDFTVKTSEKVAILGPSGSGKSTLLSLLSGLDRPTQGSVKLLDQDLGVLDEKQVTKLRAKTIGIVFQQFHLMSHLTALENVALPLRILRREAPYEKATKALEQVGLGSRLNHFPHQMSGGECQRTALARAIVTEPPLILADEPSGNLDSQTGEFVMKILFDLVSQTKSTLILVTHNEALSQWCSRRLLLKGGTLHAV